MEKLQEKRLWGFWFFTSLFLAIGAGLGYVVFDSSLTGAAIGIATYLVLAVLVTVVDMVSFNRELSAFRRGEDTD